MLLRKKLIKTVNKNKELKKKQPKVIRQKKISNWKLELQNSKPKYYLQKAIIYARVQNY